MAHNKKVYRELFLSTLRLSACTFGGGYVIVPLMRKRFAEELHWIDEREMLDMIAVAQSAPGPIAVNASLMIGYRVGGVTGALLTAIGTVLPPLLIISVISFFYRQFRDNAVISAMMNGMRAGIAAVIVSVVLDLGGKAVKEKGLFAALMMAAVFAAVYFWKVNIILVIVCCGLIGWIAGKLSARRAGRKKGEEQP